MRQIAEEEGVQSDASTVSKVVEREEEPLGDLLCPGQAFHGYSQTKLEKVFFLNDERHLKLRHSLKLEIRTRSVN